jgi:hypothetical protein
VAQQNKVLEQEETEEATASNSNNNRNKKQKTASEEDEKRRQLELSVTREALGKKATASTNDQQGKSGDYTNGNAQIDMEVDQPSDDQNQGVGGNESNKNTNQNDEQNYTEEQDLQYDEIPTMTTYSLTLDGNLFKSKVANKRKEKVFAFLCEKKYNAIKVVHAAKTNRIIVIVGDKDTYEALLKEEIDETSILIEGENGEEKVVGNKISFTALGKPIDKKREEQNASKNRTVQVINIPLETQRKQILSVLSKEGKIESMFWKVDKTNQYMVAYVTFESTDSITSFYEERWSVFIGPHQVGIIPLMLTDEARTKRKNMVFKLSGLPFGTTSFDLAHFLENHNVKYCHIPRNRKTNKPMNIAMVYFGDEENFEIAVNKALFFKGKELFWIDSKEKTCFKYGNPDHLFINCDQQRYNFRRISRQQKLKEFSRFNNRNN